MTCSQMWRNWQTRWIQVPVKAISYGFKSLHLHQTRQASPFRLELVVFLDKLYLEPLMFALANILLRPQTMDTPQTLAQKGFLSPFICTKFGKAQVQLGLF